MKKMPYSDGELRRRPLRSDQKIDHNDSIIIGIKSTSRCDPLHKTDLKHRLPTWSCIPVALILCLVFLGVYNAHRTLPTPITIKDEAQYPGRFVSERAQVWLRQIVALGARPVGSRANEIEARDLILKILEKIAQEADDAHKIDVNLQTTSGEFFLDFKPHGAASVYRAMQNVVARVSPAGVVSNHSLLINCHYDSVQAGPGATDDALNCAVMIEALRVISSSSTPLQHTLVFLFNGAEENGLQAAHGFITQHEWAKNVRAFINLEGAGSGGREIMFQAGPEHPWLLDYYADVAPHPYAQAIGEELFQAGVIPSDTDFRIFRDFGRVPGMDFAHASNGYVYHTKYDDVDIIKLGTYQHTGDNLVAMLQALGNAEELTDTAAYAEGENIFFDMFGLFMISYTEVTGIIVNVFVIFCTLITIGLSLTSLANDEDLSLGEISLEFGVSILTQVGGWLWALLTAAFFSWLLDICGRPLSWYTRPWLLTGIYVIPTFLSLAGASMVLLCFKKRTISISHFVQLQCHCLCVMLIFLLAALTAATVRSAYALLVVVLMYEISAAFNVLTGFQNKEHKWLYAHLALQVPSVAFTMYLMVTGLSVLIPISGRSGPALNPEYMIGIITTFFALIIGSLIIPLTSLLRQLLLVLFSGFGLVFIFLIMIVTPLGFPYGHAPGAPTPQRYWVFHSQRILHNYDNSIRGNDTGVFMLPMDRNSPNYIENLVPMMKKAQPVHTWCQNELFCGLPFYTSRMHKQSNFSHWVPMEGPKIPQEDAVDLKLINTEEITKTTKRYHFKLDGPSHMGIFISPYNGAKLSSWSVITEIPTTGPKWENRSTYFIYYSYGINKTAFEFNIEIEATSNWSGPRMDIAVAGHYMHIDVHQSKQFSEYLNSFPNWTHVSSWISTIELFKY